VVAAIAQAVGVRETATEPVEERLKRAVLGRRLLLLLDNFEHVTDAAALVGDLLAACPELTVLVTSRTPLELRWEQLLPVPPLALPALSSLPPPEELAAIPAVALFLNRARAVRPEFTLDERNAEAVAALCVRLDGLPLAIQLAASRSRMFSPAEMVERIGRDPQLLEGGARDLPARQQTLHATIGWSYDLLGTKEQTLFRRLGVCVSGWTLEAAEAIDGPSVKGARAGSTVDALEALLAHSLVGREETADGGARFAMLDTIRDFALHRLDAQGELATARHGHATFYGALAQRAAREIKGPHEARWLDSIAAEHDNMRAALGWLVGQRDGEAALRLVGALWPFWEVRGHWREGRERLSAALALAPDDGPHPELRAEALFGAATLARKQGDYGVARSLYEECLQRRHALGDTRGVAQTLRALGYVARHQGDRSLSRALFEESLARAREACDIGAVGDALNEMGIDAAQRGDYGEARRLLEETLASQKETGDRRGMAGTLLNLGNVQRFLGDGPGAAVSYEESLRLFRELDTKLGLSSAATGRGNLALAERDHATAEARFRESLDISRVVGDRDGTARALVNLGRVALTRGDTDAAKSLYVESLRLRRGLGDTAGTASSIEGLAEVAAAQGRPGRALRLGGAATALRGAVGVTLPPGERSSLAAWQRAARRAVGERLAGDAWARGLALSEAEAVMLALEPYEPASDGGGAARARAGGRLAPSAGTTPTPRPPLTAREREVALLVAQGCTNRQIAEKLVVTPGTAALHVEHIRRKLGFHARAQIASWVSAQGWRSG
jgi:predicted ATPase/DNA-binding CsgD family transcriptional regulator